MRSGLYFSIALTLIFCVPVFAYNWNTNSGDGSVGNPYQISEPNHLMSIGSDPNLLDKHFILTNDIVFDPNNNPAHIFSSAVIAPYQGNEGPTFCGSFDGNGQRIENLKIISNGGDNLGLFGKLTGTNPEQVVVRNLTLVNPMISGDQYCCGALAGSIENCAVESCHVFGGTVSSSNSEWTGGLAGLNNSAILSHCSSSAAVFGNRVVGGLVGATYASTIRYCAASGPVTGNETLVGGLTGSMSYGLNSATPVQVTSSLTVMQPETCSQ